MAPLARLYGRMTAGERKQNEWKMLPQAERPGEFFSVRVSEGDDDDTSLVVRFSIPNSFMDVVLVMSALKSELWRGNRLSGLILHSFIFIRA